MHPDSRQFTDPMHSPRWLVAQIGSRELYACPVSFHRRGHLRRFYTDIWWPHHNELIARLPEPLWGLSSRYRAELPPELVTSFTGTALWREAASRISGRRDVAARFRGYVEFGRWFGRRVAKDMSRQPLDPAVDALFAFSTGALEAVKHARDRGVLAVVDQLDPGRVDQQLVLEEHERWPGWQAPHDAIPEEYFERLSAEWAAADMIVVNSDFSRRAMREQGVPEEKLVVVPLCYESERHEDRPAREWDDGPLRVLWIGQVILRKGVPYLFEAARLLKDERIEFAIAGNLGISEHAVRSAPPNVRVIGKVARDEALRLYSNSHVFVLPTISDGFAITQLEAMSFGLPVIATPNCGDVVTPGTDGLMVPIRDAQALAAAILRLHRDRELLARMSAQAVVKSRQFTLDRYAGAIEAATLRRSVGREAAVRAVS